MSIKAKLGKDWIKTQVKSLTTGETLHLTLAPGHTGMPVVAWIDGQEVVGRLELVPLNATTPAGLDVSLRLNFPALNALAAKGVTTTVSVAAPTPTPPAAVETVAAPIEILPATAVQDPAIYEDAPAIKSASEGRRKKKNEYRGE